MSNFESSLRAIAQVKTLEGCAYLSGYMDAEYAHDLITKAEYTALCQLIQEKRRILL